MHLSNTMMKSGLRCSAALTALSISIVAFPAWAQEETAAPIAPAAAAAADTGGAGDDNVIIVTGSRIPQPNLESVAPVTVISSQELKLQGTTKVEDILNSLPSVFASQASTLSNGADGTASIDLRGLGTSRTLSLVNGRRLLPGDPSPTSGSAADVNMIPAALVKNVQVLTGGASTTYGADAVAGVVNFILDTDFEGLRLDGQYSLYQHQNRNKLMPPLLDARAGAGLAGYGYPTGSVADGGTVDVTLSMGTKFGDDRGHVMAYVGYRKAKPILQSNRDYSACVLQNSASSGNPQCGGSATSENGNVFLFNPDVNADSSTVYTFAPGGGFDNTLTRYNFGPTNHFQRPDRRYTAGVFANYEVNDSIQPYMEFMFMDDSTVAQIAPSGDFGNTLTVNCDNPLLSAAQSAVVCAAPNLINGFLGTFPLAQAAPYNPNPGNAPVSFFDAFGNTYNQGFFQLLRRNVEGGPRQSDLQHTNYRAVIGSKGKLDAAWSYDAYYQYARSNYSQVYSNEFSVARLNRALNVINDPRAGSATFGQPICRSVLDGSDPACVPYNVFQGAGGASAASVNYLSATGFQKGYTSEQVLSGSLTGMLGEYGFKTPWSDDGVSINIGAEHRKEKLDLNTDNAFQTGDLTGQGGATLPLSGGFNVSEIFAETNIPVVRDGFFYDLSLDAAFRKSWYKKSSGGKYNTNTYKIGLNFAPVRDIRVRGAYNRAVRAPNIQELFATPTVALNGSSDPCAGITISATDYGCIAQGLIVGSGTAANPAGQYNGVIGGNQALQPEKATTKTFGVVIQPSFIRRLAITVDYFDIKVDNAIRSFGQDSTLADCTDNATATFTPDSCALINRDAAGSLWLTPGGFVTDLPSNVGALRTKGIELNASYAQPVGSLGSLSFSLIGTYLDTYKVDNGLTAPYDCAGYYGPTCSIGGTVDAGAPMPKWRHKLRTTWKTPVGIGVSLQWRYIGKVRSEFDSPDSSLAGDTVYAQGRKISPQSYFDLATTFDIGDSYVFRLGVNNILDKQPPLVTSGSPDGNMCPTGPCNGNTYPATYDALGRYIYAGVTLTF